MEETFSDNRVQKLWEKFRKLRKSCMHKRNINRTYNEKLHYNCLQKLLTLRLKTWILGNYGIQVKGNEMLKLQPSIQPSR